LLSIWHTRCRLVRKVYFVYRVYRHYDRAAMTLNRTSQEGLKDGWIRATFILRKDYLEKLKTLAYWKRKKIKEVIDDALRLYLKGKKTRTKTNR
jgi:hypothetical protein